MASQLLLLVRCYCPAFLAGNNQSSQLTGAHLPSNFSEQNNDRKLGQLLTSQRRGLQRSLDLPLVRFNSSPISASRPSGAVADTKRVMRSWLERRANRAASLVTTSGSSKQKGVAPYAAQRQPVCSELFHRMRVGGGHKMVHFGGPGGATSPVEVRP